ncbi:MAG: hypothetical protein Alpg2KO_09120 [Alphaproteobacteria bacterium]
MLRSMLLLFLVLCSVNLCGTPVSARDFEEYADQEVTLQNALKWSDHIDNSVDGEKCRDSNFSELDVQKIAAVNANLLSPMLYFGSGLFYDLGMYKDLKWWCTATEITIDLTDATQVSIVNDPLLGQLPDLENLTIKCRYDKENPIQLPSFDQSVQVKRVHLEGSCDATEFAKGFTRQENLIGLKFVVDGASSDLLNTALKLKSLQDLEILQVSGDQLLLESKVQESKLKSLIVEARNGLLPAGIESHPKLEELSLKIQGSFQEMRPFPSFLLGLSHLKKLTLVAPNYSMQYSSDMVFDLGELDIQLNQDIAPKWIFTQKSLTRLRLRSTYVPTVPTAYEVKKYLFPQEAQKHGVFPSLEVYEGGVDIPLSVWTAPKLRILQGESFATAPSELLASEGIEEIYLTVDGWKELPIDFSRHSNLRIVRVLAFRVPTIPDFTHVSADAEVMIHNYYTDEEFRHSFPATAFVSNARSVSVRAVFDELPDFSVIADWERGDAAIVSANDPPLGPNFTELALLGNREDIAKIRKDGARRAALTGVPQAYCQAIRTGQLHWRTLSLYC